MKPAIPAEDLVAANEAAARYYRSMLLGPDGAGPRNYLAARGFSALLEDTPWTVGYAPAGWTKTLEHLRRQGFEDNTLEQAGIARVTRRGSHIDHLRDRLVLGVRDFDGSLVAFLGRAAPNGGQSLPKYLGTPTTTIHSKGDVLFGLHEMRERVMAGRPIVIVEGPFDAIAVSRSTDCPGLALCGTAMTRSHAGALADAGGGVVLCLDNDRAGRAAVARASQVLWERQLSVKVAELPETGDPGSVSQIELSEALQGAAPAEVAIVRAALDGRPGLTNNVEAQLAALKHAARVLAEAPPPNEALAASELARRTRLPYDVVTAHLAEAITNSDDIQCPVEPHRVASKDQVRDASCHRVASAFRTRAWPDRKCT